MNTSKQTRRRPSGDLEPTNQIQNEEKLPKHLTLPNLIFFIYLLLIKLGILIAVIIIFTNSQIEKNEHVWMDCMEEPCWWSNCPEGIKNICAKDLNCLANSCNSIPRSFMNKYYQPTTFHVVTSRLHLMLGYSLIFFLLLNFIVGIIQFQYTRNETNMRFIHSVLGYVIMGLWCLNLLIAYGHGSHIWLSRGYEGHHYNPPNMDKPVAFTFTTYAHFLIIGLGLQDCLLNGIIALQYKEGTPPPNYVTFGLVGTCVTTLILSLAMIFYLFWIAGRCTLLDNGHCAGDELIFSILHVAEFIGLCVSFYSTIIGHWLGSKFIVVPPLSIYVDSTKSFTEDDAFAVHAICMYVVLGITVHVGVANISNWINPEITIISFVITVFLLLLGFRKFAIHVLLAEEFRPSRLSDLEINVSKPSDTNNMDIDN